MPACLPQANHYMESKEGAKAVVTGWGLNSSDATVTQGVLQKLDLPVFTDEECKEFYGARYTRRMMCAGFKEGGKDSCKGHSLLKIFLKIPQNNASFPFIKWTCNFFQNEGDSGGPLVSEKTKQVWEQIGIVSFGEGCAEKNQPGVYINTRRKIEWISKFIKMDSCGF